MLETQVNDLIEASRLSATKKAALIDFIGAVRDVDASIDVRLGDGNWGALEIDRQGSSIARVFTKSGKVQIYNSDSTRESDYFGENVSLNSLGQWVFEVKTEADAERMLQCLAENITSREQVRTRDGRNALGAESGTITRNLSQRTRFAALFRDNFTCQYCGRKPPEVILHIDHRVPFSLGGDNSLDNLLTACSECNLGKSNKFST